MFRRVALVLRDCPSFPRAGGDVPQAASQRGRSLSFSPCRRGCSELRFNVSQRQLVFPVQAGMFRSAHHGRPESRRFPRAGGDVPCWAMILTPHTGFSPCRRGCSDASWPADRPTRVFPVQAGMFRWSAGPPPRPVGFPRAGGDVPPLCSCHYQHRGFSPCRRGCSGGAGVWHSTAHVFPVQAGMFRLSWESNPPQQGFPRAGGDVPGAACIAEWTMPFSPCRRGCSAPPPRRSVRSAVFPVQAGMFRSRRRLSGG